MVRSMTGYGRGEAVLNDRTITVEVRSVNNRYLDCTVKMPRAYMFAEDAIKSTVQRSISRGKVDIFVTINSTKADGVIVSLNRPVADGYYAALTELRDTYGLRDDISLSLLSRFQDVFFVEKAPEDVEAVAADICAVLDMALQDFNGMREREGAKLSADILSRAGTIEARLHSHLSQLRTLLEQDGPMGRKLDFLIQEFNREANTIGSKCNDLETARHVIDIKAEIEKIREQVQNIE